MREREREREMVTTSETVPVLVSFVSAGKPELESVTDWVEVEAPVPRLR
jgi:hypothetical protein